MPDATVRSCAESLTGVGRKRQFDPPPATAAIRLLRTLNRVISRTARGRSRLDEGNHDLTQSARSILGYDIFALRIRFFVRCP